MLYLLATLLIFFSILFIRTFTFKSKQIHLSSSPEPLTISDLAPQRLAQAIAIKSIADQDTYSVDPAKIKEIHELIYSSFPKVHTTLTREIVNELSLLYHWKGKDQNLKPLLLLAHMDVVPANTEEWSVDPYKGIIKDGYIWGRGALDDKLSLMGILEAAEHLIEEGFVPERSIYFAFGHDEEIRGLNGAKKLAELLATRNIEFEAILDEGGIVINNAVPGVNKPVAVIGIAEKGYLSCELSSESEGGHSSMPPIPTAIGRLCNAISRIENNPFPATIKGPSLLMYDYVGPEMPFLTKFIFANLWLFKPLLQKKLTSSPSTNASIRTT
ncbi:MAG TPA: M20/M25/M40 family metallo-hydrolase, partial [Cytophagaceae bacterium]